MAEQGESPPQIEITDEMMDAGMAAYMRYASPDGGLVGELVLEIYRAMEAARPAIVHIRCDATQALASISVLKTHIGENSLHLLPEECFAIKPDVNSTGAEVVVRLEPTDRLARLLRDISRTS